MSMCNNNSTKKEFSCTSSQGNYTHAAWAGHGLHRGGPHQTRVITDSPPDHSCCNVNENVATGERTPSGQAVCLGGSAGKKDQQRTAIWRCTAKPCNHLEGDLNHLVQCLRLKKALLTKSHAPRAQTTAHKKTIEASGFTI